MPCRPGTSDLPRRNLSVQEIPLFLKGGAGFVE
jgi:hypothetical protein